ncbi:zinc finger protein [Trypanosoma vivax]|nr:zinc finger protein [Trypanosoma vivax]
MYQSFSVSMRNMSYGSEGSSNFAARGKYRAQLCRNYRMGQYCSFGSRCAFSHGEPVGGACTRMDDMDFAQPPPPPSYPVAMRGEHDTVPAARLRFRHNPYSLKEAVEYVN